MNLHPEKWPYFCQFFYKTTKLLNKLGHMHEKIRLILVNMAFSCRSCTISYVYPKRFINGTIFAEFVPHFSGWVNTSPKRLPLLDCNRIGGLKIWINVVRCTIKNLRFLNKDSAGATSFFRTSFSQKLFSWTRFPNFGIWFTIIIYYIFNYIPT